jgi:hypothetical protein
MIRGYTDNGSFYIGLVRGKLLDRLLAGERVCLPGFVDRTGVHYPHLCLFVGDDNAHLVEMMRELFPDGQTPDAVIEQASREEPDGS